MVDHVPSISSSRVRKHFGRCQHHVGELQANFRRVVPYSSFGVAHFELKPRSKPASSSGDFNQELHYGWSALLVVLADLAAWASGHDPANSQSPPRAPAEHCMFSDPAQVETFCYLWKLLSLRWWKSFTIGILLPLGFCLQVPCDAINSSTRISRWLHTCRYRTWPAFSTGTGMSWLPEYDIIPYVRTS